MNKLYSTINIFVITATGTTLQNLYQRELYTNGNNKIIEIIIVVLLQYVYNKKIIIDTSYIFIYNLQIDYTFNLIYYNAPDLLFLSIIDISRYQRLFIGLDINLLTAGIHGCFNILV